MPFAQNGEVQLCFEVHGSGDPLVLITGLGGTGASWAQQIPMFERSHTVITLDPRGAGASSIPISPYTTADMATDVVAVLDEAGIDSAHILGVGLGGMAAQQLAIHWGDRVNTLSLFSTFARGDAHVHRLFETWAELLPIIGWEALGRTISLWTLTPRLFAERPDALKHIEEANRENRMSHQAYSAQVQAVLDHNTCAELHLISAPTLVLLGEEDIETPLRFASELVDGIPRSELTILPKTGHRPHVESPEFFNRTVLEFLSRNSVSLT